MPTPEKPRRAKSASATSRILSRELGASVAMPLAELFSTSWPLMGVSTLAFVLMWMDVLLMGVFRGSEEVGVYNACARLAVTVLLLHEAVGLFDLYVYMADGFEKARTAKKILSQAAEGLEPAAEVFAPAAMIRPFAALRMNSTRGADVPSVWAITLSAAARSA